MAKHHKVVLNQAEVDAFHCITFMLEEEADNVNDLLPDGLACDVSRMAVGELSEHPTVSQVLHAIAGWVRSIINRAIR